MRLARRSSDGTDEAGTLPAFVIEFTDGRERVAAHEHVQLRLGSHDIAGKIFRILEELAGFGFRRQDIGGALVAGLVADTVDFRDLLEQDKVLAIELHLRTSIRQLEIGGARLCDCVEFAPASVPRQPSAPRRLRRGHAVDFYRREG